MFNKHNGHRVYIYRKGIYKLSNEKSNYAKSFKYLMLSRKKIPYTL